MVRFPSALCLVVWLSPAVASGQGVTPDTTPFHRGQWAAQFGAGTSFASLGFVKFTTPTRAWVLDFHLSGATHIAPLTAATRSCQMASPRARR